MDNVIYAADLFHPDTGEALFDVAPLLSLLLALHKSGVIAENTLRLGLVVCAYMQHQSSYTIQLNHQIAAHTATLLDGEPLACQISTDRHQFMSSMRELQQLCAVYSHPTKVGITRAKSRHNHFTEPNTRNESGPSLSTLEMVFFQFRVEEFEEVEQIGADMIRRQHWINRFAEIRTK